MSDHSAPRAFIARHTFPQSPTSQVLGYSYRVANRAPNLPYDVPKPEPDERERVWDYAIGCWVLPDPPAIQAPEPGFEPARPQSDASGVFWDCFATRGGTRFWRIEASTFEKALAEKRRLCQIVGARSREMYLKRIRD